MSNPAKQYFVTSAGWDWASVFLQGGRRTDAKEDTWYAYIAIVSSYGVFGHHFSHLGEPVEKFLAGCDFHYLMKKIHPEPKVFDWQLSIDNAIQNLLRERLEGSITKEEARSFYDGLIMLEPENGSKEYFLNQLEEIAGAFWGDWCLWENAAVSSYNTDCQGLWDNLWPKFLAELKTEAEQAK